MSETMLESRLIGELFVERGLVTEEQLQQALALQDAQGGKLGEILVAEFGVSRVELASVLAQQWAEAERGARADVGDEAPEPAVPADDVVPTVQPLRRPLGEIFVERGLATEEQLEAALEEQRRSGSKLGEILVSQGILSRLDLAGALADQWASLQKLRPPDPKPIEPWQQVAPRELAAEPGPTPAATDDDDLGVLVAELDRRVRSAEAAASTDRWREDVRAAADALGARITALEHRLDGVDGSDASALDELRAMVAEVTTRIDGPHARLDAVEERLGGGMAELGARLDALAERLGPLDGIDDLRGAVGRLQRELDELAAPRDELQSGIGDVEERVAGLEHRLESLAAAEETGASAAVEDIRSRLDALAVETARVADLDGIREEIAVLRDAAAAHDGTGSAHGLAELHARLDAVAANSALGNELTGRVHDLAGRLDALAADAARSGDVETLRDETHMAAERLAALQDRLDGRGDGTGALAQSAEELFGDRLGRLESRLAEITATRETDATRIGALVEEIEALRATAEVEPVHDLSEVVGRLDELAGRVEDGATRIELTALAGDLGAQVAQLSAGVQESITTADAARSAASAELRDAVAALEALIGTREAALRDGQASITGDVQARVAEVWGVLDAIGARIDEIQGGAAGGEGLQQQADALEQRLDGLSVSVDSVAAGLAETRAVGDGNAHELVALRAEVAMRLDELAASLQEGLARLERRADEADRANASSSAGTIEELRRVSDRVVEVESATIAAGEASAGELERVAGSLTWRLEQVERALADGGLAERLAAIEHRLEAGATVTDEHVRATEKALRKGLAALAERITEAEGAYVDSGNALRLSIERLGFAIAEADVRIAERDDAVAVEQHLALATAYVAFAPTDEGYRLVALDGTPPAVGEEIELGGRSLVCTRVGTSPLPLDARPCVYLEPRV